MAASGLNTGDGYGGYREQLVDLLRSKGIHDLSVLNAVSQVPRHLFVPEAVRHRAYEDSALPIGGGQTISQPFVQAQSLEMAELKGDEKVLEVGTGSGYQTALLARLASVVFTVERIPALAREAKEALDTAGIRNVSVLQGDGTLGWRPYAPYDAIIVSAASPSIPEPLADQLAVGGRLVIPLGDLGQQTLMLVRRTPDGLEQRTISEVRFVPLLGRFGFDPNASESHGR